MHKQDGGGGGVGGMWGVLLGSRRASGILGHLNLFWVNGPRLNLKQPPRNSP